jgi:hypothetical protein
LTEGTLVPVSAELKTLNRAIEDVRTAVTSLRGKYGDIPVVARLRNDLERLMLDVSDVDSMPPSPARGPGGSALGELMTDEPYDPSLWTDADDEGVGGYHGRPR